MKRIPHAVTLHPTEAATPVVLADLEAGSLAHYGPASNQISVAKAAPAFEQYVGLFEVLVSQAQHACKADGVIKRLAGPEYVHHISFQLFCYLAMSGLVKGITPETASAHVRGYLPVQSVIEG